MRIHRGFVRKVLLGMSPLYICHVCGRKFTERKMANNEPIYYSAAESSSIDPYSRKR